MPSAISFATRSSRRHEHVPVGRDPGPVGQWSVARDDLRAVVGQREVDVRRRDHALDGAAVGEVDVGIARAQRHDVARRQDIRVGEIHVGVAIGVGIGEVLQGRLAPLDLSVISVV